jgi:hypothetical protein
MAYGINVPEKKLRVKTKYKYDVDIGALLL